MEDEMEKDFSKKYKNKVSEIAMMKEASLEERKKAASEPLYLTRYE